MESERGALLAMRLAAAAAFALSVAACSSQASLQGAGGECLQVTDCAAGLVCVPADHGNPVSKRVCSADPSSLVSTIDSGGPDATVKRDASPPSDGATDATAPPDAGGPDTGGPDTSVPPDTGGGTDSGGDAAPTDAGPG